MWVAHRALGTLAESTPNATSFSKGLSRALCPVLQKGLERLSNLIALLPLEMQRYMHIDASASIDSCQAESPA
jgi:hypothetical protein